MAAKKALLFGGNPIVTHFAFDESAAISDSELKYLRFEHYSLEWGRFIKMNRDNKTRITSHDYDIVFGPIANDTIGFQLRRLKALIIDEQQFTKEIEHMDSETYQYFFGTDRALKYLKKL